MKIGPNLHARQYSSLLLCLLLIACQAGVTEMPASRTIVPSSPEVPAVSPTGTVLATRTPAPTKTATATPLPGTTRSGVAGMLQVYIPAGEFWMGAAENDPDAEEDEKPLHLVHLGAFWIDQTEVTNAMYELCVNSDRCAEPNDFGSGMHSTHFSNPDYADHPVYGVSNLDALDYCEWAGGDLPTEAEWERAARGSEARLYPWGDVFLPNRANLCDLNCPDPFALASLDDMFQFTAPVGFYPEGASPEGILDMAGNVSEWVRDGYDESFYASSPPDDPLVPADTYYSLTRGGSYRSTLQEVRVSNRIPTLGYGGSHRSLMIGFRCVDHPGP